MARRADPVAAYAAAVIAGRVVAGRLVRLACERHQRDIATAKARGLVWRLDKARDAIAFFRDMLVLEDGRPFELLDWQEFVVGSVFGWYNAEGFRRFRTAYVETGKGSGKTPLAAGVGLKGLIADGEPAAEIYSAATDREQARIVWQDAWRMVKASPELSEMILAPERGTVQIGTLAVPADNAIFKPCSSEHRGLDGHRVHMALIDELHEHRTAIVVDKMRAGTKRRRNALIFEITNAGYDRTSVCWAHHDLSVKVLEGSEDNDGWFAYVCGLDTGDDWRDERVWPKANPGFGRVLPVAYLREQVRDALTMPSKENIVRRLNFCEWTEQHTRWLDMAAWDACGAPFDPAGLAGRRVYVGLDMASRRDLCAAAFLFPDDDGGFDLVMRFWLPADTLAAKDSDRSEADRLMLAQWAGQGFVTVTPGNVTDYDLVEEQLLTDFAKFQLIELAHDSWNVTQLITHIKDRLGEQRVVDYPQSFKGMSSPSKELEKLLSSGKLRHGGNPVLRWMAANVSLRFGPDAQIKPDRDSSREKIDGVIALVMALGRATLESTPTPSVYEERGLLTL